MTDTEIILHHIEHGGDKHAAIAALERLSKLATVNMWLLDCAYNEGKHYAKVVPCVAAGRGHVVR